MSVVTYYPWAAVKARVLIENETFSTTVYDVWKWSLFKRKWIKEKKALGFETLWQAQECAKQLSADISDAVRLNKEEPAPLE